MTLLIIIILNIRVKIHCRDLLHENGNKFMDTSVSKMSLSRLEVHLYPECHPSGSQFSNSNPVGIQEEEILWQIKKDNLQKKNISSGIQYTNYSSSHVLILSVSVTPSMRKWTVSWIEKLCIGETVSDSFRIAFHHIIHTFFTACGMYYISIQ